MDFKYLGDCHNIAIALHRIYNLPIVFFYGERIDDHGTEHIMIHVGVDDGGNFRDFEGICSDHESSLEEYIVGNDPYDNLEIFEFDREDDPEFLRLVNICGSSVSEDRILIFLEKIKEKSL